MSECTFQMPILLAFRRFIKIRCALPSGMQDELQHSRKLMLDSVIAPTYLYRKMVCPQLVSPCANAGRPWLNETKRYLGKGVVEIVYRGMSDQTSRHPEWVA